MKLDKIGIIAIIIFVVGGGLGINMIFMWDSAVTLYDQCEYGSHSDIFGTRCITHSEMQEILECNDFYLRDGYWWECNDTEYITKNYTLRFEGNVTLYPKPKVTKDV